MVPNTKSFVLDSAVQHGITLGMRYLEIYGADISDTSLTANIATANTDLLAKASQCNGSTGIHSNVTWNAGIAVYPNPVADRLTVILPPGFFNLVLCDLTGRILFEKEHISEKQEIMVSELIDGVYLLKADDRKNRYYQKIFVCK
jgi:hypothetical protein